MPIAESKHFDTLALLTQVHQATIGLEVKTNHPQGFRRHIYNAMRETPQLRCRILQKSPDVFFLVRPDAVLPDTALPESISAADIEDEL